MSADGASLMAAAVRAAVLAKAPRRTVHAVASAVAGVFARPATAATPEQAPAARAGSQRTAAAAESGDKSADELLHALRAARSAQRRRKKARRHAGKETARAAAAGNDDQQRQVTPQKVDETAPVPTGGDLGGGGLTPALAVAGIAAPACLGAMKEQEPMGGELGGVCQPSALVDTGADHPPPQLVLPPPAKKARGEGRDSQGSSSSIGGGSAAAHAIAVARAHAAEGLVACGSIVSCIDNADDEPRSHSTVWTPSETEEHRGAAAGSKVAPRAAGRRRVKKKK